MSLSSSNPESVDFLVVGAGLAGCAVGYLLKRTGARVLLLERRDAWRKEKLCAGIVERRAEDAFSSIYGMTMDEAGLSPTSTQRITVLCNGHTFSKNMARTSSDTTSTPKARRGLGTRIQGSLRSGSTKLAKLAITRALGTETVNNLSFRVVTRKNLDDYARDRYLEAGGQIMDCTTIRRLDMDRSSAECINRRTEERFTVRFSHVIGADGATSATRTTLTGQQQRTMLALEASTPLFSHTTFGGLTDEADGYCWYIPHGDDATLGCVYHGPSDSSTSEVYRARLSSFCEGIGVAMPAKFQGALIPTGDNILLRSGATASLVGDAAGLADAFTGGGIHYALLSAQALASSFDGGTPYEEAMRTHVDFVRKNSESVHKYYSVARTLVSKLG